MAIDTLKQARRIVTAVFGFTLVLLGIVMIVTPGPGLLVIVLGLTLLSAEFVWARRLLRRIKTASKAIASTVFPPAKDPTQPSERAKGTAL